MKKRKQKIKNNIKIFKDTMRKTPYEQRIRCKLFSMLDEYIEERDANDDIICETIIVKAETKHGK